MAGEQSITLLTSEFEGRGARITQVFNRFLLLYNTKLGVLSKPRMINIGTRTDIYAKKPAKQVLNNPT